MGKANVTEIDIRRPRECLVKHLEGLLEQAKSGDMISSIEVCLYQGGGVSSGWSIRSSEYLRTMIGELEVLKLKMLDMLLEEDG